jgi:hypothetical protein
MRNVVVVTFTEPGKAYGALAAMKALDDSDRLSLHTCAVVERLPGGEAAVREHWDRFPFISRPHGLVGRLIDGLLGTDEQLDIAARITPGSTGVIAEVGEYEVEILDRSMARLGGTVFRASNEQVTDAFSLAEEARRTDDMKVAQARSSATEKQLQADWDAAWQEQKQERAERHERRLHPRRGPPGLAGTVEHEAAEPNAVIGRHHARGGEQMPTMQEFFTREHERLTKIETSIVKTKTELEAARTEAMGSLKTRRDHLDATREARHKQMTDANNRMRARMDAKRLETAATIDAWKHQREVHKLEQRAKGAEDYADAALAVLELAQEEARAATLEAIEARREAEEAKLEA